MLKFIKSFLLFVVSFTLLLFSCSDKSTNNNEPQNQSFFPTTVGSFWKYLDYELDSLSVKVPNSEDTTLTTLIANQFIFGKNASIFLNKTSRDNLTDTTIFAFENNKIYTFLSFFENDFIPISEGNQWVMIADFDGSQWTILKDTTLETIDLPDVGKMTPTIGIKGKKGNQIDLVVKGKPVQSQEFILTFTMNIKLEIPNVPLPVNVKFDVVQHYWFGKGIGLVRKKLDPFKFNIFLMEQVFNGNQSDLIDYNIK